MALQMRFNYFMHFRLDVSQKVLCTKGDQKFFGISSTIIIYS